MRTRQSRSLLHRRQVNVPTGLRMKLLVSSLLLLVLCSNTEEMAVDKTRLSRWQSHPIARGQRVIRNLKRHSDGTFTSDFTNHLDKIKAKDFVEWLADQHQARRMS